MRIFILDTYYRQFLDYFYSKNSNLKKARYAQQKEAFNAGKYFLADFYSKNLKNLGHQAEEFIVNNNYLQSAWAKEHGLHFAWEKRIIKAQIEDYKPDIVYCQDLKFLDAGFLAQIKKKCRLLVGQIAAPIDFDLPYIKLFDLILSSVPAYVEKFRSLGVNSEYLKIGFEKSILEKLTAGEQKSGAVFIGSFSKHHQQAVPIFEYLVKRVPVDFWGNNWENLPKDSSILTRFHREQVWGMDMYNILYNSKISINRHINIADQFSANMRVYESTGVGTMLLTDYRQGLSDLFEVGKEVETYKTKEELVDKVKYYLAHEKEREKIAKAGQKRTLKDHTYESRMKELVVILKRYMI